MRLSFLILLPALIVLPALGAEEQPSKESESAEPKESPEMAAERKKVEALIAQLGSEKFEEREAAEWDLKVRGGPVLPLVRKAMEEAKDPGKKEALTRIIDLIPPWPDRLEHRYPPPVKDLAGVLKKDYRAHFDYFNWVEKRSKQAMEAGNDFGGRSARRDTQTLDRFGVLPALAWRSSKEIVAWLSELPALPADVGGRTFQAGDYLRAVFRTEEQAAYCRALDANADYLAKRLKRFESILNSEKSPSKEEWGHLRSELVDLLAECKADKDQADAGFYKSFHAVRVSMAFTKASPLDVVNTIALQSYVRVFFEPRGSHKDIENAEVTINIDDEPADIALKKVVAPLGYDFRIEESGPYREGRVVVSKKKEEGKAEVKDAPAKKDEKK